MFVLICQRVVKVNTGAREKFAPRSANQTRLSVSGAFLTIKSAQRAALVALGTHTCLDAQIWSDKQIAEKHAKGYGSNGDLVQNTMNEAMRLLAAVDNQ